MKSVKTVYGIGGKGFAGNAVTLEISKPGQRPIQGGLDSGFGQGRPCRRNCGLVILPWSEKLYESLCITCHGTPQKEGSLPTVSKFHAGEFKTAPTPGACSRLSTKDLVKWIPQPQYSIKDKYALIPLHP